MSNLGAQYFSHLNGLSLTNSWGEMIRILDICLVDGLTLPPITSAEVGELGDIVLDFSSNHNCQLFQIVELMGFAEFTGEYRVKGVPSSTRIVLKATFAAQVISVLGSARIAPLGYETVFTATDKRVYRAKNPESNHPYIRVDESLQGVGSYTATYQKFAMVGLLESMSHIDDVNNPDVLQLPFTPSNPSRNWDITGTGGAVVRGWSKWFWGRNGNSPTDSWEEATLSTSFSNRRFTLVGDKDAFYLQIQAHNNGTHKTVYGTGIFDSGMSNAVIPNWFLMTTLREGSASSGYNFSSVNGGMPLGFDETRSRFFTTRFSIENPLSAHVDAQPIMPSYYSGQSNLYSANNVSGLEIPFKDTLNYLRGTLKHILFSGKSFTQTQTTPVLDDANMYVVDSYYGASGTTCNMLYYLGELDR